MTQIFSKALLACALLATVWALAPARAQVCSTSCSRYEEGNCVEEEQTCTTPPPPESFGAIAYSHKTGAFGYSYQWHSRAEAESNAMKNCSQRASDCEIMVWYDRRCGAVVSRSDSTEAYWGIGETVSQARTTAMNECTKDKGRACEVKVSQCSR